MASWLPRGHGSGLQGVPELGTEIELGNSGAGGRLSGLPADPEPGPAGPAGEPGGVPPSPDGEIGDQVLAASGSMATRTIDLSMHFYDPDGDDAALTYTATSADTDKVTASVAGSTLTLTAVAITDTPVRITVQATDADGLKSGTARFDVTVAETVAPMVTPIPDRDLYQDDDPQTITLSEHFTHDRDITYTVSSEPAGHVRAEIADGILTLTPRARGEAIVTVTATADEMPVTDEFSVDVKPGSKPVPPKVAPTVELPIEDPLNLYLDEAPRMITLGSHFRHTSPITYSVEVGTPGIVTAEIADGVLTVTPRVASNTLVTITATADDQAITDTFTVSVAATRPVVVPEPVVPDMPAQNGTIDDVEVEAEEDTDAMDVSGYFTPTTGLTYTAMSSDEDKAKADIPTGSSMLTITGVAEGMATVTVTAKNDAGMITQTIAVRVTSAMEPYKPDMVTIAGVGKDDNKKDVTIDVGQTLVPEDPSKVSVAQKDSTVWTITGLKKGMARVRIVNPDTTVEKSIMVTVENSPPEVITTHPRQLVRVLQANGTFAPVSDKGATGTFEGRSYHLVPVPWAKYFEDADGPTDIAEYIVTPAVEQDVKEKHVVLTGANTGIVVDVIRKVGASFSLSVRAVDKSKAESDPVIITVEAVNPIPDNYESAQERGNGDLDPLTKVWRRYGATHTVKFTPFLPPESGGSPDHQGFNFVKVARDIDIKAMGRIPVPNDDAAFDASHAADVDVNPDADAVPDASASIVAGDQYYTVKPGESVELVGNGLSFDAAGQPMIAFKIKDDSGSSGSISITYNVVTCVSDATDATTCATGDAGTATAPDYKWDRTATKTLRMTIVPSS